MVIGSVLASSCCKEGTGGNVTIAATIKHHSTIIQSHVNYPDTVFVKFDANKLPGTNASDFDTFFVGEAGEDHVHIHGLKCGSYFFYAAGMDSSGPYRVTGGIPFKIKHKDRDESVSIDIPVTE